MSTPAGEQAAGASQTPQNPSSKSQSKCELTSVVQQKPISAKAVVDKIYEQLHQQFPDLKKIIECRFPGDSYNEALKLKKENFGKVEQSFSEVHRIRKILKLGESVCKVIVKYVSEGTGFVLFDSFILTSAHLFKGFVKGGKLQEGVEVFAQFGYEDPEPERNFFYFTGKKTFVDFDVELDYAILELNPKGKTSNQQTTKAKVPQGLLDTFGPLPLNGEACIIGHPSGGLKKMDPTWIIEIEKREQAVEDHLHQYKDNPFTILAIDQLIMNQGIGDIMRGGNKTHVATYHSCMYHGASGSPVVDALSRVFGLHTAGFVYGFPNQNSVIEFAQPVLTILIRFVDNLRKSGNKELLKKVRRAAKENDDLEEITRGQ